MLILLIFIKISYFLEEMFNQDAGVSMKIMLFMLLSCMAQLSAMGLEERKVAAVQAQPKQRAQPKQHALPKISAQPKVMLPTVRKLKDGTVITNSQFKQIVETCQDLLLRYPRTAQVLYEICAKGKVSPDVARHHLAFLQDKKLVARDGKPLQEVCSVMKETAVFDYITLVPESRYTKIIDALREVFAWYPKAGEILQLLCTQGKEALKPEMAQYMKILQEKSLITKSGAPFEPVCYVMKTPVLFVPHKLLFFRDHQGKQVELRPSLEYRILRAYDNLLRSSPSSDKKITEANIKAAEELRTLCQNKNYRLSDQSLRILNPRIKSKDLLEEGASSEVARAGLPVLVNHNGGRIEFVCRIVDEFVKALTENKELTIEQYIKEHNPEDVQEIEFPESLVNKTLAVLQTLQENNPSAALLLFKACNRRYYAQFHVDKEDLKMLQDAGLLAMDGGLNTAVRMIFNASLDLDKYGLTEINSPILPSSRYVSDAHRSTVQTYLTTLQALLRENNQAVQQLYAYCDDEAKLPSKENAQVLIEKGLLAQNGETLQVVCFLMGSKARVDRRAGVERIVGFNELTGAERDTNYFILTPVVEVIKRLQELKLQNFDAARALYEKCKNPALRLPKDMNQYLIDQAFLDEQGEISDFLCKVVMATAVVVEVELTEVDEGQPGRPTVLEFQDFAYPEREVLESLSPLREHLQEPPSPRTALFLMQEAKRNAEGKRSTEGKRI